MEHTQVVAAGRERSPDLHTSTSPTPSTLVIRDGTLIDGTGAAPRARTSVFILGDRITRVASGEVAIPPGADVVEARGLTILPGLIDAHVHARLLLLPIFLKFGVTTVRDLGADPDFILAAREQERRGEIDSPRIIAAGPLLDGDPLTFADSWWRQWRGCVSLSSVAQARAVASSLIDRGVDWLKVYCGLTPDMVEAIVEVGRERGVPVAADLQYTAARDAAELGVRSIEHVNGVPFFSLSARQQRDLIAFLVEQGTFIVPTLHCWENLANLPTIGNAEYPHIDLVPEGRRQEWLGWRNGRFKDANFGARKEVAAARRDFVRRFHRAGGKVAAGSDTPNPFVVPGASLHAELRLLVSVGLSPLEAIHAATGQAAAMLDRPDLGVVEAGRLADLVLVAGDPADDISTTGNVRLVVKGGVRLPCQP